MKIWAHRGSTVKAKENTIQSIKEAVEFGAHGSEIDLRLSLDDIVLHHDTFIKNKPFPFLIGVHTKDEISKKLNYPITSLSEVFSNFKPHETSFIFEAKVGGRRSKKRMLDELLKYKGDINQRHIIISSFSKSFMFAAKKNGFRAAPILNSITDLPLALNFSELHINKDLLKSKFAVDQLIKSKKIVRVWTVNDDSDFKLCKKYKFEVITDNPKFIKRL